MIAFAILKSNGSYFEIPESVRNNSYFIQKFIISINTNKLEYI